MEPASAVRNGGVAGQRDETNRPLGPDARRDLRLLLRYRRFGDRLAIEELTECYTPVARGIAARFSRGPAQFEDLLQVALVGFISAVKRFDLEGSRPLFPYAYPTMAGEVRRYLRDTSWALRVSRSERERHQRIREAARTLTQELGREPDTEEIAARAEINVEEVDRLATVGAAFATDSLDEPLRGADGESSRRADTIGEDDDRFSVVDEMLSLAPLLKALPMRDREILFLRYSEDLTQSEIGDRTGLSQMHVSRLLSRSLGRLRAGTVSR
ncbi:MAG: sigma-70 family RNA polymerase sigma factor [Solirubrobacterales bacterium]